MAHTLRESKLGPLGDDDASNYDRPMTNTPETAQRISIMASPAAATVVDSRSPTPADRRSNRFSAPISDILKSPKRHSDTEERYGYDEQGRYGKHILLVLYTLWTNFERQPGRPVL